MPVGVEVVELTDPGCSWSWGSEPKLRLLRWRHGDRLRWRRVLGGLVGDMESYVRDFDPLRAVGRFTRYWRGVAARTGMPSPSALTHMYRSTEPACRAVKAAELQGEEVAARVLRRLRESTFVFGDPPDRLERIFESVAGVPGLDVERLAADLVSGEIERRFRDDWEEARRPDDLLRSLPEGEGSGRARFGEGRWRYAFPTLIVRGPRGERTAAGWQPFAEYAAALEAVCPGLTAVPRPAPDPATVLETWGTAAEAELATLCGAGWTPPPGAVAFRQPGGVLWMTREEAGARGVAALAARA